MDNPISHHVSPFMPLKEKIFRFFWLAALVSNIGTWMESVGESWLMTTLTHDPLMIALVESATSLPIFLLALPSGALADILNRRRYLIFLQSCMVVTTAVLATITYLQLISPYTLLFLTFLLGIFTALAAPTWQATTPELITKEMLPQAIALNSFAMNTSKVVGPAIAGFIIAAQGPAAVFILNTFSFFGMIFVLTKWQEKHVRTALPAERIWGAMRAGVRYVRQSRYLLFILLRAFCFLFFASVVFALLPLIVRTEFKRGPSSYGFLLACLGIGAITCVLLLPKLRAKMSNDQIIFYANITFCINLFLLAFTKSYALACVGMFFSGVGWLAVLATLNTLTQLSVSPWVRARVLSIYLSAFFGGMATGSILWGFLAKSFSLSATILFAGIGLIVSAIITRFLSLEGIGKLDLTPTIYMTIPPSLEKDKYDQGPVMVNVEYIIAEEDRQAFGEAMQKMRRIRLREGCFFWNLFEDLEKKQHFVECFMVESWIEHLRQHERSSTGEKKIRDKIREFHRGKNPPLVTHFLAYQATKEKPRFGISFFSNT